MKGFFYIDCETFKNMFFHFLLKLTGWEDKSSVHFKDVMKDAINKNKDIVEEILKESVLFNHKQRN